MDHHGTGRRRHGHAGADDSGRGPLAVLSRLLGAYTPTVLILVVGVVFTTLLTSATAEIYDAVAESEDIAALDRPVLHAAVAIRMPALNAVVAGFTLLGGPVLMPILAVAALAILSARRRSWTPAVLIAVAGCGSLLMTVAGKQLVGRARPPLELAVPPVEHSPSFPSGHALNALVVAGIVAYLLVLRRRTAAGRVATVAVAALFAVAMGLSRVYLGVHWLTDVLAAWTLGAAWLAIVITAHRLLLHSRERRRRAGQHTRPDATG